MRHRFDDQTTLLEALRKGDNAAFTYLYQRHFAMIAALVRQNGGDHEAAKEVFQETMVVLFRKLRDNYEFTLSAGWATFIYAVARNIWRNRLKTRSKQTEIPFEDTRSLLHHEAFDDGEALELEYTEQQHSVAKAMKNIGDDCRELLNAAFFLKLSGEEIAEKMNYSVAFVKVKKYRCLEALRKQFIKE